MISAKCTASDCPQHDVEYHIMGDHDSVWCGGCGVALQPYDLRPDPELFIGFPIEP